MEKLLTVKPRTAAWFLLLLWMVASAFYYAEHLFSPSFYLGYDEGTMHKVLKYVVCMAFSVYFCIAARAYSLLAGCTLLLVVAGFLVLDRGSIQIATLSIMATATMLPFILVPMLWGNRLLTLGRVLVFCGAIVGIFSIIELTVLTALFQSAWTSVGAIRSVSTLFNPNNLALYVSACLLLLPFMRLHAVWVAICGALLLFSLAASGSRTAWLTFALVLGYEVLANPDFRARLGIVVRRHASQLILTGIVLGAVYAIYSTYNTTPEIEIRYRGTDLYTASIRWDNFLTFLDLSDLSLFFPDFMGIRSALVQDSFYLMILNSFGLLGLMLLMAFLATHFAPLRSKHPDLVPWKLIFAFYMVSGLSGSQLNAFPNNQLFFISMGALWAYRPAFGNAPRSTNAGTIHPT